MQNQENIKDCFSKEYRQIKTSLESDLAEIHSSSRKIIDGWLTDVVLRLQLSAIKNKRYFEESADRLYFVVKDYFRNHDEKSEENQDEEDKNDARGNFILQGSHIHYSAKEFKKRKRYLENLIEDAKIVDEKPVEYKKENYTSKINDILLNSDKEIKDVALILSGRFCNAYGVKDRKPKRLWKWKDRLEYLQGLSKENNFQEYDAEQKKELSFALQKNKYLKTKRKEIYEKIRRILN